METLAYQSLLDVSQAILQHRDLAGLFRDLATRLRSILPFDFLNLVLHNPLSNTMRLHILENTTGATVETPQLELAPEESPSGWVFLHQEWRFASGGKCDVLAVHLASKRLGIIEFKSDRMKLDDARAEVDEYGRDWLRDAAELAPFFTALGVVRK